MTKKKTVLLRMSDELYKQVKENVKNKKVSVNSLIIDLIKDNVREKDVEYKEIICKKEKEIKCIRSTIRFTKSEAEILSKYAQKNGWKITQEIRYRVIGGISKKGKVSGEEMELIKEIRQSINALGRNVNRIIREDRIVDQEGKDVCKKLVQKIIEVNEKIIQIEENSKTRFIVENREAN